MTRGVVSRGGGQRQSARVGAASRQIALTAVLLATMAAIASSLDAQAAHVTAGTGAIAGRVVTMDATPQPVRRAIVTIAGGGLAHIHSVVTGDDGRFLFASLPAGRFTLTASKPAFITSQYGAKQPGRPGTAIALAAGEQRTDLTITLPRGAVITGTIHDERGDPLADAEIAVFPRSPGSSATQITIATTHTTTDDRGVYRVYGLTPGSYFVSAQMPGARGATRQYSEAAVDKALQRLQRGASPVGAPGGRIKPSTPATANASGAASKTLLFAPIFYPGTAVASDATSVVLDAGDERTVDFTYRAVPSGEIDGTITGSTGVPPGMQLILTASGSPPGFPAPGVQTARAPGSDGAFTLTGVAPGRYVIAARTSMVAGANASPTSAARMESVGVGPTADAPILWAAADVRVDGDAPVTVGRRCSRPSK